MRFYVKEAAFVALVPVTGEAEGGRERGAVCVTERLGVFRTLAPWAGFSLPAGGPAASRDNTG